MNPLLKKELYIIDYRLYKVVFAIVCRGLGWDLGEILKSTNGIPVELTAMLHQGTTFRNSI